ncbi:flagellar basal body-associated FliL family protein [Sulfitobacter sp. LCG007]
MSDAPQEETEEPKKPSKLPLIIGIVLALAGGGGGFFAVWSGMILGPSEPETAADSEPVAATPAVAFVSMEPLVISLPERSSSRLLKFRADLEVPVGREADVELLLPRAVDVLNSYLRALDVGDIEDPASLARLRSQMLRRVQTVTGPGMVNDLLVMEFVLN